MFTQLRSIKKTLHPTTYTVYPARRGRLKIRLMFSEEEAAAPGSEARLIFVKQVQSGISNDPVFQAEMLLDICIEDGCMSGF